MQGEERDSSDEEWANAYVAMDPLSQLGWRNRRAVVEGPAEQLVRDILEAADAVHSDAMAEMVASTNGERPPNADEISPGHMASHRGRSESPPGSVEVEQEGEPHVGQLQPQSMHAFELTRFNVEACHACDFNCRAIARS